MEMKTQPPPIAGAVSFCGRVRIIGRVEPDPVDDAMLMRDAREHARKLAVALAADEADLARPSASLTPQQLDEGRAALAELLAAVSHVTESLDHASP